MDIGKLENFIRSSQDTFTVRMNKEKKYIEGQLEGYNLAISDVLCILSDMKCAEENENNTPWG